MLVFFFYLTLPKTPSTVYGYRGTYTYKTGTGTNNYRKTNDTTYTYSTEIVAEHVLTLDIADNLTPIKVDGDPKTIAMYLDRTTNFYSAESFAQYVTVDEIYTGGALTEFVVNIMQNAAIQNSNFEWVPINAVTTDNVKVTIKFADGVSAVFGEHKNAELSTRDTTTGNYTFKTDKWVEGYIQTTKTTTETLFCEFNGQDFVLNSHAFDGVTTADTITITDYARSTPINYGVELATDADTLAISRTFANETFTAGSTAGTYTYNATGSTAGWNVSADGTKIASWELNGKTFMIENLRTDLGNLGFDSQGYIHATNGSTIGRMGVTVIKLYDNAVHKLATPILTGADAADFTLILPS